MSTTSSPASKTITIVVVVVLLAVVGLSAGTCATGYWISSEVSRAFSSTISHGVGVGLIRFERTIVSGRTPVRASEGVVYSEHMIKIIEKAEKDKNIKAIVLRIDSPGGSVVGSNEIYRALLKVKKPIIVSMGEMAASGGYYISCPATKILVNGGALTGSIGVIAMMPNVSGLMEKLGVQMNVIKSGKLKDEGSPFRPMTDEEKAVWQTIINEAYDEFVAIVAQGRKLPPEKVREIADGRVYTGLQAIKLGLADQEGNLPEAIKLAGELGGIKGEPAVIELYTPPSLWETLLMSVPSASVSVNIPGINDRNMRPVLQYLYVSP